MNLTKSGQESIAFSYATHAIPGHLPLKVRIYNPARQLVQELVQAQNCREGSPTPAVHQWLRA